MDSRLFAKMLESGGRRHWECAAQAVQDAGTTLFGKRGA